MFTTGVERSGFEGRFGRARSGAKAPLFFAAFSARLNRLRKKACLVGERPEKRTSVAKATTYFIVFIPGINPRSTTRMSFSAACEVVP
jgi:hypothetical protein